VDVRAIHIGSSDSGILKESSACHKNGVKVLERNFMDFPVTRSDGSYVGNTMGIGVYPVRTQIANLCLVESRVFWTAAASEPRASTDLATGEFVIVDAGMPHSSEHILAAIHDKFGPDALGMPLGSLFAYWLRYTQNGPSQVTDSLFRERRSKKV
jgi:hypothetical protein